MATFTIHNAKTNLSKLIAQVEAGEEVIIARGDKPVARLVPIEPPRPKRVFGRLKGLGHLDDSFFEPMSEEELADWEGAYDDAKAAERPAVLNEDGEEPGR